jgi:hypothetical protein
MNLSFKKIWAKKKPSFQKAFLFEAALIVRTSLVALADEICGFVVV